MKILEGREQDYKDWLDKNTDSYGRGCFTYAERWAEMMENIIESSTDEPMKVIVDNADRLSHEADVEGITGFMYGCAVSILSQCWKYRRLHCRSCVRICCSETTGIITKLHQYHHP